MRLDELKYELPTGGACPRVKLYRADGVAIELWAEPDHSDYDIFVTQGGRYDRPGWLNQEPIMAQCLLYYLLETYPA